jgi:hypothetical protein
MTTAGDNALTRPRKCAGTLSRTRERDKKSWVLAGTNGERARLTLDAHGEEPSQRVRAKRGPMINAARRLDPPALKLRRAGP